MNQPKYLLDNGTRVVTHDKLGSADGMSAGPRYSPRRASAPGVIAGVVGGHGGDVYWVRHDDGETAAYCFDEFELGSAS